ncbi:uncharacterized protein LOC109825262 isoform X1 [Asparagus officinalis]|uniref:uncharacterized protein LOC109825262 isoform X1 n=1 Tax=Asparagus officinalis TaxID=4686 RepID=UPI00098E3368|nr:uncharacterized protein LOC109825262 isoform X1 [Asparagus officinalis]
MDPAKLPTCPHKLSIDSGNFSLPRRIQSMASSANHISLFFVNDTKAKMQILIRVQSYAFSGVRTDTAQVEGGVHGLVLYDKTPF